MSGITPDEARAIKSLQRLAKTWPKSLWLFSASGALNVMKKGADGQRVILRNYGVDPDYSLATIKIENDGGDW